jgi:hypothetical protein
MSKQVEKWMPGSAARKIDEAMALLRQGVSASPLPTKTGAVNATLTARLAPAAPSRAPEIIDVQRVCAVHDQQYFASYVRGANGLLSFTKSFRIKAHGNGGGQTATKATRLDPSQFDPNGPDEVCAWCATKARRISGRKRVSAVLCGSCDALVCLGRTEGVFFRCRDSCGGAGELSDRWVSSRGITRKDANPQPSGAAAAAHADTGKKPLLLPASSDVARRK